MKLIGIDLDGTLLNSRQEISRKNTQAIENLPEDCFPFICSGREIEDINNILKKTGLTIPAVGLNGSVGYDKDIKLFEFSFDKNEIKKIASIVSKFPTKIYTNLGSYESKNYKDEMKRIFHEFGDEFSINELNYELEYEKSIVSTPYSSIEEITNREDVIVYKFFIFIPNRKMKSDIFNHLEKLTNITVTESAAVNLEIVPHNVSKGIVFNHMESIYGLKKASRIAIGDSLNDFSMFENADISFAMGNGHHLIKNKADYITASNDDDGVSEAFGKIILM
ncbi:Cof-like hydrolase [Enterococcus faecalis 13-SD-W-01]|nr:Cof-like hydrolase [Enterococcus faecalis 13-SD-W-01]